MDSKNKELGNESIIRLLFKYSVPAIIAMMVNALYTVDRKSTRLNSSHL